VGVQARAQESETVRVEVLALDSTGAGVTGATCSIALRRSDTANWWNGTAWQVAYTTNAMTELDSVNLPGRYYYDASMPAADATVDIYASSATASVVTDPWHGQILAGKWVDYLDTPVSSRATASGVWSYVTRTLTSGVVTATESTSIAFLRAQVIVILQHLKDIFRRLEEFRR